MKNKKSPQAAVTASEFKGKGTFPSKEEARKVKVLTSDQLEGLNEMQVAVLLYYLIANNGRTAYQIEVIGSSLESVAMQSEKL